MDFNRELIFIDGRDKEQIDWLKSYLVDNKKRKENKSEAVLIETRVILTGGKILELQKELEETLYFDQAGELTSKFGIKQVPALVVQEEKKLKLREIKI